jgi:hypothetical protein
MGMRGGSGKGLALREEFRADIDSIDVHVGHEMTGIVPFLHVTGQGQADPLPKEPGLQNLSHQFIFMFQVQAGGEAVGVSRGAVHPQDTDRVLPLLGADAQSLSVQDLLADDDRDQLALLDRPGLGVFGRDPGEKESDHDQPKIEEKDQAASGM